MTQLPRNSSMAPVHWGGEDSFAQGHWESSEQSRIPEREGFFEELESCHRPPGVGGDEGPAALLYWVCPPRHYPCRAQDPAEQWVQNSTERGTRCPCRERWAVGDQVAPPGRKPLRAWDHPSKPSWPVYMLS